MQLPDWQTTLPLVGGAHLLPQAPQLAGSLAVLAQAPLHAEYPVTQVNPHWLPLQTAVPLATPGHAAPQPPQLPGSEPKSTHVPLHAVVPAGQFD